VWYFFPATIPENSDKIISEFICNPLYGAGVFWKT
jgi:hypothetical protein